MSLVQRLNEHAEKGTFSRSDYLLAATRIRILEDEVARLKAEVERFRDMNISLATAVLTDTTGQA